MLNTRVFTVELICTCGVFTIVYNDGDTCWFLKVTQDKGNKENAVNDSNNPKIWNRCIIVDYTHCVRKKKPAQMGQS